MKDFRSPKAIENEASLFDKAMNAQPKFTSKKEAIREISEKLESLALQHGCSVSELLHKAETTSEFNEDLLQARYLRMTLSSLKKL